MADRVIQLKAVTNESLLFLVAHGVIGIDDKFCIKVLKQSRPSILKCDDIRHPHNFFKKAEKVGAWFGNAGGVAAVYAMLGVRP
jgi:hypothetical protein